MNGDDTRSRRTWRANRDQLAFSFDHRPALGGDDFLVAGGNREAVAWLDRWRDWPQPVLVLHGPPACGKTHLGQVFLAATGGRALALQSLAIFDPASLSDAPAFLIEDADRDWDGARERPLLHLYNWIVEGRRRLLLTARRPAAQWGVTLADLRSRLLAALSVAIGPPDDALIAAVLVKLFADRQLRVDEEVIAFLLPRIERSFATVRALVSAIDAAALAEKRAVTVPLVARVLGTMPGHGN